MNLNKIKTSKYCDNPAGYFGFYYDDMRLINTETYKDHKKL